MRAPAAWTGIDGFEPPLGVGGRPSHLHVSSRAAVWVSFGSMSTSQIWLDAWISLLSNILEREPAARGLETPLSTRRCPAAEREGGSSGGQVRQGAAAKSATRGGRVVSEAVARRAGASPSFEAQGSEQHSAGADPREGAQAMGIPGAGSQCASKQASPTVRRSRALGSIEPPEPPRQGRATPRRSRRAQIAPPYRRRFHPA